MTEPTTEAPRRQPVALATGGTVMAFVPQTFEELQRIANTIIAADQAPRSLIKFVKDDATDEEKKRATQQNIAAVSGILMAGAELGLPPMVSLRLMTNINNRPALYADGNVAVARMAKDRDGHRIAKRINCGVEVVWKEDNTPDPDLTFGWCEAERADTGEAHREEFSVRDAMIARLWDTREEVEREIWQYDETAKKRKPVKKMLPNEAPWFRYWKRMLMWRATGYCLRWLFADVLGGMPDEYEAREIEGLIDITPPAIGAPKPSLQPPDFPEPPEPPATTKTAEPTTESADVSTELHNSDQPEGGESEVDQDQPRPEFVPSGEITPAIERELEQLTGALALCRSEEKITEEFDALDVQTKYAGNDVAIARALQIKHDAVQTLALKEREALEADGQGSLLS